MVRVSQLGILWKRISFIAAIKRAIVKNKRGIVDEGFAITVFLLAAGYHTF
jgi:hypothetical protein